MGLNLVLVAQRQTTNGLALSWSPMEDVASYEVFVANRKLSPEELEGAQALGGSDDCIVVKLGGSAKSVVDDVTPVGEPRFYAVAMMFKDGTVRAARFRAIPDGAAPDSIPLSSLHGGSPEAPPPPPPPARPAPAQARPTAPSAAPPAEEDPLEARKRAQREARERAAGGAPSVAPTAFPSRPTTNSGYRVPTPAAAPPADEDPLEARKRAQREARERAAGGAPSAAPAAERPAAASERPSAERAAPAAESRDEPAAHEPEAAPAAPAAEDPLEARKRAQREARERAAASGSSAPAAEGRPAASEGRAPQRSSEPAASAEPPPPASSVPLDGSLDLAMKGSTQTWDGLRLYWERAPGAAAYEVIASDHQIFDEEVADAFAGRADFTIVAAVAPSVTCVIDNVTAREARGWYSVVVRTRDGKRSAHPFQIGDAATSGKKVAPFLNPNRTGEVRAEVEDLVGQAREQWSRWKSEQDGGARREARRLIDDALLIFPNHPAAKALSDEMSAG